MGTIAIRRKALRAEMELPPLFGVGWSYERLQLSSALPDGDGFRIAKCCNFAEDALVQLLADYRGKVTWFQPGKKVLVELEFSDFEHLAAAEARLGNLVARFSDAPQGVTFQVTECIPGLLYGQALEPGAESFALPAMPLADFMAAYIPPDY